MDTRLSFIDYPKQGASQVRIQSVHAHQMGWVTNDDGAACIGIICSQGEVLCATVSIRPENKPHPFQEALDLRDSLPDDLPEGWTKLRSVESFFTIPYRVFDFKATWVSKKREQLALHLGSAVTSLLGWDGSSETNPPLCPFICGPVLALFSKERLDEILTRPLGG